MRRACSSLLQRQLQYFYITVEPSFSRCAGCLPRAPCLLEPAANYITAVRCWSSADGSKRMFASTTVTADTTRVPQGTIDNQTNDEVEHHDFKAETQKLLQIVTHSLYTDKEVFIRELISNASDALEKLRFLQATEQQGTGQGQLRVVLRANPTMKTFTIEDNGVGMSRDEVLQNLGTIAKSGSLEFLQNAGSEASKGIIGQFGVGFYACFVVSERVEVYTRSGEAGGATLCWSSDGSGSFTLSRVAGDMLESNRGTRVVCHLKPECVEFANPHRVKECAQKFSSFVNFPVYVEEDGKEVLVTSQEALWLKSSATEEEHTKFFRYLANQSWGEPIYSIMFSADAPLSIRSGVSLHSRRVLVKKSASDLLPKWLWFVRGVVDCEDLPLNVSREHVQNSQLQRKLASVIVKRILKFLNDQAKSDPEKYKTFYQKYSQNIKEGVLEDAQNGSHCRDMLLSLLRFECSTEESRKMMSLDDYVANMPETQKHIYYYCCSDRKTALASPYMEQFISKGRPVILMTSEIDEFLAMNLSEYKGKRFVGVDSPDEDVEPEADDDKTNTSSSQNAQLVGEQQTELAAFVKETLASRVTSVKFSERLLSSPAVVSGFLSPTLRRMMKATLQGAPEAQLNIASLPATLELNPSHELITSLYHLYTSNPDVAKLLVEQLLDNARVAAGILEEPKSMLPRLNKLLSLTAQYAYHHARDVPSSSQEGESTEDKLEERKEGSA